MLFTLREPTTLPRFFTVTSTFFTGPFATTTLTFRRLPFVLAALAFTAGSFSDALGVAVPARLTVVSGPASEATWITATFAPFDEGSNTALTLHVAPGARLTPAAQSPPTSSNSLAFTPVIVTPESAIGCVPAFVSVDSFGADAGAPAFSVPKSRAVGSRARSVWMPLPDSGIVISAAFEVTDTLPLLSPVLDGSKRTRTLQVSPAFSAVPEAQSSAAPAGRSKSAPLKFTPVSVTGSVTTFVIVAACGVVGPAAPSWLPSARLAGPAPSSVCVPVPVSGTTTASAFEVTVKLPVFAPTVAGSNVTL